MRHHSANTRLIVCTHRGDHRNVTGEDVVIDREYHDQPYPNLYADPVALMS